MRMADRALGLAEELGLPRPARALGFRSMARTNFGDRAGLDDYREAIDLAMEAGQGREVALLHNNLGHAVRGFEGPAAALAVYREGIAYARARGITEMVEAIGATSLDSLFDLGRLDEALKVADELSERAEARGDVWDLIAVRAVQARITALRGGNANPWLDWLESSCRGSGDPQFVTGGLGGSALVRAGVGQDEAVAALLDEVATTMATRQALDYAALLPAMVRTAVGIGAPELAGRLVTGLEPRYPYAEHALVAANASLAEARGDIQPAVEAYADAADRWDPFGVVAEQAFALLGRGRCLLGLSRPSEAAQILQRAREIFQRLRATPSLAETDGLLQQATLLSS
jgi:tetratricopeptide (TPR) repeat protein